MKPQTSLSDPLELLELLAEQGVQVFLEGDKLKATPKDKLTPDLVELMRPHAQGIREVLASKRIGTVEASRLPWQLERLIRAAYAGSLPITPTRLPAGGLVTDLGGYVLQACALHLLGSQEQATKKLWAAYSAWQGVHHA